MAKILALEPWYGGSHRNFLDGLVKHSGHEIQTITMAGRFWKWRMQGGAVTLAKKANQLVESGYTPDLICTCIVFVLVMMKVFKVKLGEIAK